MQHRLTRRVKGRLDSCPHWARFCRGTPHQQSSPKTPNTLLVGIGIILISELLLFYDVNQRGGIVIPIPDGMSLPLPANAIGRCARWVALNMTVFCWVGHLLLMDGLLLKLALQRGDRFICSTRSRPNRFVLAWLASVPIWCFFDWVNFRTMRAWRYHGLPPEFSQRVAGYFIAFAAIGPGMFMVAQLYQQLGLKRVRCRDPRTARRIAVSVMLAVHLAISLGILMLIRFNETAISPRFGLSATAALLLGPGIVLWITTRKLALGSIGFGLGFVVWALTVGEPLANLALWVGVIFLLDPFTLWLGQDSILGDWQAGRWGRTLSLFAGGATCGLLWEFWNYWALAKWTYDLPFLGALEEFKCFEMPLIGFLGFLPFALEYWVTVNVISLLLKALGLRIDEGLPSRETLF